MKRILFWICGIIVCLLLISSTCSFLFFYESGYPTYNIKAQELRVTYQCLANKRGVKVKQSAPMVLSVMRVISYPVNFVRALRFKEIVWSPSDPGNATAAELVDFIQKHTPPSYANTNKNVSIEMDSPPVILFYEGTDVIVVELPEKFRNLDPRELSR